jgi:hypothetical protein
MTDCSLLEEQVQRIHSLKSEHLGGIATGSHIVPLFTSSRLSKASTNTNYPST